MPTIQAAIEAAARHRARRAAEAAASTATAAGAKSLIAAGPLLRRSMAGRPLVNREWSAETAIDKLFKGSAIVYRGIVGSATAVGSVRWQAEVKVKDRWEVAPDSELQALLERPHKRFNRQAWTELLVMYLGLNGNALNQKTLASGKPLPGATKPRILEMVPLVPKGVDPVPDEQEWIARYEYKGPPRRVWQPDEMLHVMLPDPGNLYWGCSPLKAALDVILMDLEAVRWNASSMRNRAISDGVFSVEPALTTAQYEELKDQVWEQHQGADRAHEPWVLGGGAKWLAMERTPVEMDFNASRMRAREEILSSLGIPPVLAGYFENATLANAEVSRAIFWQDNAIPTYVERIASALNSDVVPHFGDPKKLRVTFDISGIPALREDLQKKATTLSVFVRAGVPYNDALRELELDLPEIPGIGDVPFGLETARPSAVPPPAQPAPTVQPEPPKHAPHRPQRKTGVDVRTGVFATAIADQEAPAIRRAFLAELAKLRDAASLEELAAIIRAGDAAAAIAKLGGHRLSERLIASVGTGIEQTLRRGADLGAAKIAQDTGQILAVDGSRLRRWLTPYVGERAAQLTNTTEAAARDLFLDLIAGKLGDDPAAVAKLLRDTWGLHRQQASGVRNVYASLLARGKTPADAAAAVEKLAQTRLGERGAVMAEHESLVAANRGNGLAWEQASADGQISAVTATWYTEEDGDVDDECVSLADQEIDLTAGERFRGASGSTYREPPEPHPRCRCGLLYSGIA